MALQSLSPPVLKRLTSVRSIGAITGAGISKESGIPTYRGKDGIYEDQKKGDATIEALSGPTLASDPDRTWRVVAELARRAVDASPNVAHLALADMEEKAERFVLLTQNVDGLHRQAGSCNIIDIHGDIFSTLCMSCGASDKLRQTELIRIDKAPPCGKCPGILRPDVVLFGELLPLGKIERLRNEFYARTPDMVIICGTSALFPYIVEPVIAARRAGKVTIEINPERTPLSGEVEFSLRGSASRYLPAIAEAL